MIYLAAFALLAAWAACGARWPNRVPLPGLGALLDRTPVPHWPHPRTPPRAHGGAGEPRTALRWAVETGARRTRPGTAAAAPAAVPAMPMTPKGRHHATAPLRLVRGTDGLLHHGTGPMPAIPDGYGTDLKSAGKLVAP